jgi:hypothetical protein
MTHLFRIVQMSHTFVYFFTGLSDEARADFNVMRDLAVHTRIGPEKRVETLENFLKQINASDKVKAILSPWQTQFDKQAFRIPARQFPPENLLFRSPNVSNFICLFVFLYMRSGQKVCTIYLKFANFFVCCE